MAMLTADLEISFVDSCFNAKFCYNSSLVTSTLWWCRQRQ